MTDSERAERIENIKTLLDIAGDYADEKISLYLDEVTRYMIDAGVPERVVEGAAALGCVARGVDDLMRPDGELSQYFKGRVVQLALDVGAVTG